MNEKFFNEIMLHLLEDSKPSIYLKSIIYKLKDTEFDIINKLEKVCQSPIHHPEGNVLNHTLLVVDAASLVKDFSKDKKALMLSALFHDIGKVKATRIKNGRIIAYNHDKYGKEETLNILNRLTFLDENFKIKVSNLVYFHMHSLYISKNLPFGNLEKMMNTVDLSEISLLFFSDRLGRGDFSKQSILTVIEEIESILDIISNKYIIKETITLWKEIKNKLLN